MTSSAKMVGWKTYFWQTWLLPHVWSLQVLSSQTHSVFFYLSVSVRTCFFVCVLVKNDVLSQKLIRLAVISKLSPFIILNQITIVYWCSHHANKRKKDMLMTTFVLCAETLNRTKQEQLKVGPQLKIIFIIHWPAGCFLDFWSIIYQNIWKMCIILS